MKRVKKIVALLTMVLVMTNISMALQGESY